MARHSIFGNPTECKYAAVTGGRAVDTPWDRVVPFIHNMFSESTDRSTFDKCCNDVISYIGDVQQNYADKLKTLGLISGDQIAEVNAITGEALDLDKLERLHEILSKADGSPGFFRWRAIRRRLESHGAAIKFPASLAKEVLANRNADSMQDKVNSFYIGHGMKILFNKDQMTIEYLEYLSHIAASACFAVTGDQEEMASNSKSALSHLKRITLDMYKAILGTIALSDKVSADDLRSLLWLRHTYCCQNFTPRKDVDYLVEAEYFATTYPKIELDL